VCEEKRDRFLQFLARAIPFYERPGDIQVTLYESLDNPGLYLELVAYGNVDSYEADQLRVETSPEYSAVLKEWHEFIEGKLNVARLKRVDLSAATSETGTGGVIPEGVVVETAAFNDHNELTKLLTENDLPVPGIEDQPVRFITARCNNRLVGCLGWESYGFRVLLRSLAVQQNHQRQGIATQLVHSVLSRLAIEGVSEFYLLTNNAAGFAARFGFKPIDRGELPRALQTSHQVASSICSKAQCMQLGVIT
jgi:N-acetylglutamate synthase-like GNAT family acetyltransferase